MEKVICLKCGSIGYTASPQHVNCSECGGSHRVIDMGHKNSRHMERRDKDANIDITFK